MTLFLIFSILAYLSIGYSFRGERIARLEANQDTIIASVQEIKTMIGEIRKDISSMERRDRSREGQ